MAQESQEAYKHVQTQQRRSKMKIEMEFDSNELLEIIGDIGEVIGILTGLSASMDGLEDDRVTLKTAIERLTNASHKLRDKDRITFVDAKPKKE